MVLNRLKKNRRKLESWYKKSDVSCYRLYDADIPEYAVAIDVYDHSIYVQEYVAPSTISEKVARERFGEIKQAVKEFSANFTGKIYYKERRRQKGDSQYEKLSEGSSDTFTVSEGKAIFEINLSDYLDTGLFLDHRPVRSMIGEMVKGKRFLNLFCYTAAASVQAALAGAASSLSIDMSNTYLDWAQRNYDLNSLRSSKHKLLRADCMKWLESEQEQYDIIFLDPPTFSNSKKMDSVLRWRCYSQTSHPLYLHANPYTTGRPLLCFLDRDKGIENDLELLIDNLLHTNDAPGLVCVSS